MGRQVGGPVPGSGTPAGEKLQGFIVREAAVDLYLCGGGRLDASCSDGMYFNIVFIESRCKGFFKVRFIY